MTSQMVIRRLWQNKIAKNRANRLKRSNEFHSFGAVAHAKSLRIIGQSLEAACLGVFAVASDGKDLLITSEALTETAEWILCRGLHGTDWKKEAGKSMIGRAIRFTPEDISVLDQQAQRRRGVGSLANKEANKRLSQILRTIGDHLDRTRADNFRVTWRSNGIEVDSTSADGHQDSRTFLPDKLEQLGSHLRFRRSATPGFRLI